MGNRRRTVQLWMLTLTLLLGWGATTGVKACFEVIPKIHSVKCYYGTNFQDYVVRVGSLRMLGNIPGTGCTCALHNNSPIFDLIDYIAVVDSGTNHRVDGVAPWYPWALASSGWDSIYQIVWKGFLSSTQGTGTVAGQPVELIIRAHFPPGYALIPLQNDLPPTILGWGTWNDSLGRPNSDRWWLDWPVDSTFQYIPIDPVSTFFADFDDDLIYTGLPSQASIADMQLYPSPATDVLHLRMPSPNFTFRSVAIYDLNGRCRVQGLSSRGNQLDLDIAALPAGTYFLRFQTAGGAVARKFTKVN
jgi:hypothetical protein